MALLPIILFYLPVISGLCARLKLMVSFYFRESNEISKCANFPIKIWPPVETLKKEAAGSIISGWLDDWLTNKRNDNRQRTSLRYRHFPHLSLIWQSDIEEQIAGHPATVRIPDR